MQVLLGLILAVIVAYLAYRAHSLDRSGAIAATFVGTVIFGLGGWQWAVLLLLFFILPLLNVSACWPSGVCKFN